MFNFNNLQPKNEAVPYVLWFMEGNPTLHVLPAGEVNRPYFQALLKLVSQSPTKLTALTTARISEERNQDRQLFAKHVIQGWEGVRDTEGNLVPFSYDNCLEFLRALPDNYFDEIRNYAKDLTRFVGLSAESEKN